MRPKIVLLFLRTALLILVAVPRECFAQLSPQGLDTSTSIASASSVTVPPPSREWHAGASIGVGFGTTAFGGHQNHDVALGVMHVRRSVSDLFGGGRWYEGRFELVGELFGGTQFHPRDAYLVGLNPMLRYSFMTSPRCTPFVQGGVGFLLTDISEPDLSTKFQFNDQLGIGIDFEVTQRYSATAQYRFVHISNAGFQKPNSGANNHLFMIGFSRRF